MLVLLKSDVALSLLGLHRLRTPQSTTLNDSSWQQEHVYKNTEILGIVFSIQHLDICSCSDPISTSYLLLVTHID